MSNYSGGRRGPNVSQYLRDLNAISRPDASPEENFIEDLSIFTNTQFYDFETGQNTDYQAHPTKVDTDAAQSVTVSEDMTPAPSVMGDLSGLDLMTSDFNFSDFTNTYPSTPLNGFPEGTQNFPSMQSNSSPVYSTIPQQHQSAQYVQPAPQSGTKRKPENGNGASRSLNLEEASRQAADEDKRRRNTAASARFRIKKKQREQALEKSAKEMSDKVSSLESKVQQLEMENKWLKNLLVEKNEGNDEIVKLWKEFASSRQTSDTTKADAKTDSTVKEEKR